MVFPKRAFIGHLINVNPTNMLPSISIAMATFNGANFLLDQLNSLAAQTYLPDALWITDDGSTDATQLIVNSFAADAPFRVNFFANHKRLGYGRNFLKAASLAVAIMLLFATKMTFGFQTNLNASPEPQKNLHPA